MPQPDGGSTGGGADLAVGAHPARRGRARSQHRHDGPLRRGPQGREPAGARPGRARDGPVRVPGPGRTHHPAAGGCRCRCAAGGRRRRRQRRQGVSGSGHRGAHQGDGHGAAGRLGRARCVARPDQPARCRRLHRGRAGHRSVACRSRSCARRSRVPPARWCGPPIRCGSRAPRAAWRRSRASTASSPRCRPTPARGSSPWSRRSTERRPAAWPGRAGWRCWRFAMRGPWTVIWR